MNEKYTKRPENFTESEKKLFIRKPIVRIKAPRLLENNDRTMPEPPPDNYAIQSNPFPIVLPLALVCLVCMFFVILFIINN